MYKFKIEKREDINKMNQSEMARITGVSRMHLYLIFNKEQKCSKVVAYSIVKFIYEEAEILDYFERV